MPNKNFDYIMFDAGGTLIDTNSDSEHWYEQFFVDMCAEQGCVLSLERVHEVLSCALTARRYDKRSCIDSTVRAFWQDIYCTIFSDLLGSKGESLKQSVVEHLAADYIDRFEDGEFVKLFPDVRKSLETLKELGYPMAVVSQFGAYLPAFLQKLEVCDFFEFATITCKKKEDLPPAVILDQALEEAKVSDPSRVLFIGDKYEDDYLPAIKKGMTAILLDRENKFSNLTDVPRIKTLCEIKEYL